VVDIVAQCDIAQRLARGHALERLARRHAVITSSCASSTTGVYVRPKVMEDCARRVSQKQRFAHGRQAADRHCSSSKHLRRPGAE
jgi:hypothetical protein